MKDLGHMLLIDRRLTVFLVTHPLPAGPSQWFMTVYHDWGIWFLHLRLKRRERELKKLGEISGKRKRMGLIKIGYCFAHIHESFKQCRTQAPRTAPPSPPGPIFYIIQPWEDLLRRMLWSLKANHPLIVSVIPVERRFLFSKKTVEVPGWGLPGGLGSPAQTWAHSCVPGIEYDEEPWQRRQKDVPLSLHHLHPPFLHL